MTERSIGGRARAATRTAARALRTDAGRERYFAHAGRAVAAGATLLVCVALLAVLLPTGPLGVDESWSEAMRDIEAPALTHLALVLNALGSAIGRAASLAVVALVLLVAGRWLALVAFALAEGITPLVSSSLKALVGRPRPPDGLIHAPGPAFPSGHASFAGVTCVALVLLFTAPGPRRRPWWAVAGLGIIGMAWSRTYLQVHWLSDVIGGSLLGIGVGLLVFGCAEGWIVRQRRIRRARSAVSDSTGS